MIAAFFQFQLINWYKSAINWLFGIKGRLKQNVSLSKWHILKWPGNRTVLGKIVEAKSFAYEFVNADVSEGEYGTVEQGNSSQNFDQVTFLCFELDGI